VPPIYPADKRCAPSAFNVSCPLRWQAASRPSCRRRACPVHCQTVRPCYEVHCVHHHLYVAMEASPARQYYADHGCQGTRRLLQQRTLVAPSITSVVFLGPHVGAQYPCTCPLSYKRGGMHHYNTRSLGLKLTYTQAHLDPAQAHKFIQALKLNTSHSGVGYYAPASRTTLNSCVFLCYSHFPTNK
jgi:hypothetical protein